MRLKPAPAIHSGQTLFQEPPVDVTMELRMKKTSKSVLIALLLILIFQGSLIVYFGSKKTGYHIDEMFTFTLSNYPDGLVVDYLMI